MRTTRKQWAFAGGFLAFAAIGLAGCGASTVAKPTAEGKAATTLAPVELLNVSYDPTRELWKQINEKFIADWQAKTGQSVTIKMSHGGSGTQARAVIDGLEADVVTLALWTDTQAIHKAGLIESGWDEKFPNGSLPYSSTIVFVVRQGNPKGIQDWPDLIKQGVEIITPNPKTSGGGKLNLLSAWGSVVLRGGSEADASAFLKKLYQQVPVLDSGARAATTTFSQKGIGDVFLTWENEAHLAVQESGGQLELVYPKISIRAEPRVALVDANVDRKQTREVAKAYLDYLYTAEGQAIIAKNHYRPSKPEVLQASKELFPALQLFSIQEISKSWEQADEKFFAEGGVFDSIYGESK